MGLSTGINYEYVQLQKEYRAHLYDLLYFLHVYF